MYTYQSCPASVTSVLSRQPSLTPLPVCRQSLSAAICFFYSNHVPLYYQLLILVIFAVLGTVSFWRVELSLRRGAAASGTWARRCKQLAAALIAGGLLAARVYSGTVLHKHPPATLD